jgi:uncharacterized protein
MAVSDTPWSQFTASDYSAQQWRAATLIDTEEGSPDSKDRYKLPYKEPNGEINRNGVHAAAERINQVQGVAPEKKAEAARKLVSVYRNDLGETPPDSLLNLGGDEASDSGAKRSAPPLERLWSTTFLRGKDGSPVELRSKESRSIGGYAAVFQRNSENLGGFIETVDPQFFNRTMSRGWGPVVCRFNHQDNYLLGATYSGTLRLSKDNVGLNYEADLPECRSDVFEMVGRGDIRSSSFAFQCYEDEWRTNDGGTPVRNLLSGKLIDVAPVTVPAYPDATVGLRSLARFVGAPIEDVVERAAKNELRGFFTRTDGPSTVRKPPKSGPAALMEILSKRPDDPIGRSA